jgi:predicted nucleotidyltransferase
LRGFLDRDFIRTVENMIFCVVGGVHPKERVISYLKYVPSQDGKWGKDQRYSRTMPTYTIPSLLKNIDSLTSSYPQYVFNSKTYHIHMSAVPKRFIDKHYYPEKKFEELLASRENDILQHSAVQLVKYLSEQSKVNERYFGITGSILLDIHKPEFSDIDLLVYGRQNSLRLKETLIEEFKSEHSLRKQMSKLFIKKILQKWTSNYPVNSNEAKDFFERRWSYGFFNKRAFSIHPVKTRDEINEKYGDNIFHPEGIVTGRAIILDSSNALFLPSTYIIDELEFVDRKISVEIKKMTNEIVSYDGFYMGLFNTGDKVEVKGKLERIFNKKNRDTRYRILVGSPEARGKDYIKPF